MTASEESNTTTNDSATTLPGVFRAIPADLAAVLVLTFLTVGIVSVSELEVRRVRVVLGSLFVLFAPGYAAVAALFPERGAPIGTDSIRSPRLGSVGGIERIALSLGMSIAIVPLLALLLNLSPIPFELGPVLTVLGGFVVVSSVVAIKRRLSLPAARRFGVPYRRWLRSARESFSTGSPVEAIPVAIIVVSLLFAGAGVDKAIMSYGNAETYTEFYLLSGDRDGVGQATNYTTNVVSGEEHSVIIGIGNQEQRSTDYVVVVRLQRMRLQDNRSVPVSGEELARSRTTVPPNRTVERRTTFTPTQKGDRLRLQFLLYRGNAPADPSVDTAYRELHLWVDVS